MPSFSCSAIFCFFLSILTRMTTTAAAPLCSDTVRTAGGGIPDGNDHPTLSAEAVKEFQLALFLENLEAFYFQSGLQNISTWGMTGYPNDTIEVLSKIVAVSRLSWFPVGLTFCAFFSRRKYTSQRSRTCSMAMVPL